MDYTWQGRKTSECPYRDPVDTASSCPGVLRLDTGGSWDTLEMSTMKSYRESPLPVLFPFRSGA